jgi:hypothetical protein
MADGNAPDGRTRKFSEIVAPQPIRTFKLTNRGAAPPSNLGPLEHLVGTWTGQGTGWNMIALPFHDAPAPATLRKWPRAPGTALRSDTSGTAFARPLLRYPHPVILTSGRRGTLGKATLRASCAYRKLNPNIVMVQSAQDRIADNASSCLVGA